jgi:mannan endo-1,4-beta-mannosidase
MKKILISSIGILLVLISIKSESQSKDKFVTVKEGHFYRDAKPYYYIGANFWYGAILGSKGKEGNRQRLVKELDLMKANGIDNLRVLAGAEDPSNDPRRVSPALQTSPGVYNQDLLEGLDFLLAEMGKRRMVAILYLNNAWTWSGGFSQYVTWNTKPPTDSTVTTGRRRGGYVSPGAFLQSAECMSMYRNHIKFMLSRKNQFTGIPYTEDPAIMTWELANEPRAFSKVNKDLLKNWVDETSAFIKSLDPNHLVTTGSEGEMGCENDIDLFEKIHSSKNVDYLTIHIWPFNWNWLKPKDMAGTIGKSIENTADYIEKHLTIAHKLNKPIVLEEFGMGRDGYVYKTGTPVAFRDKYYESAFNRLLESVSKKDFLAGANFWAFGGIGKANPTRANSMWLPGDDYLGDPPQEAQGLNAVFADDPTMKIIKNYNKKIVKAEKK